jgi:hypothetical protein
MSIGPRFVALALWALFSIVATTTVASPLFFDDFESYVAGAPLAGQGNWSGGPAAVLVRDDSLLPTNVLGGIGSFGASETFLYHEVAGLSLSSSVAMSFDALAGGSSHNSSAGFGDPAVTISAQIGWTYSNFGSDRGWLFELRLPGVPYTFFNAGTALDTPGHFGVMIDRTVNEVWGVFDLGAGEFSTPHYAVAPASLMGINGVITHQDFRGTKGIDIDNIRVEAVPEPVTLGLTAAGIVAMALRRRVACRATATAPAALRRRSLRRRPADRERR